MSLWLFTLVLHSYTISKIFRLPTVYIDTYHFYSAARLALCQFEALTLSIHGIQLQHPHEPPFVRIQSELEDGIGCIDDTMRRFLARGLVHHLPISTYEYRLGPILDEVLALI